MTLIGRHLMRPRRPSETQAWPKGGFSLEVHWTDWAELQRRYAVDESWFPQPVR